MILQIDGAPAGGGRQIDLVLGQELLVLGDPVAQGVGVVRGNDGHLCGQRTDVRDMRSNIVLITRID